jgi:hypothetical protein
MTKSNSRTAGTTVMIKFVIGETLSIDPQKPGVIPQRA